MYKCIIFGCMGAYQDLLANPIEILNSINPNGAHASHNCPATAAAVVNYLDTGRIVTPAGNFGMGFIIREELQAITAPGLGLGDILRRLQSMPSESRIVVYGSINADVTDESGRHHFFVLLKIDREVYYAEAYRRPAEFVTGENAIRSCFSWMRSFLYWTGGFHVSPGH